MKLEHILIVEDNIDQANELSAMVSSLLSDAHIFIATCYEDALYLVKQETFQCFLLDILLSEETAAPSADGISLGKQIRFLPQYTNTPIIYLTSYSNRMQEAINDIHCYGFLYKPYNLSDIKKMLLSMETPKQSEQLNLRLASSIFIQLSISDIQYVKSDGKYMMYHTTKGTYRSRQYKMNELQEMFASALCRCHKSYLFNRSFYDSFDSVNQCVRLMQCNDPIPVGRKYFLEGEFSNVFLRS